MFSEILPVILTQSIKNQKILEKGQNIYCSTHCNGILYKAEQKTTKQIQLLPISLNLTCLQYFSAQQSSVSNNTFPQLSFLKERQHAYKVSCMKLILGFQFDSAK
jgi:hypothetical protein